MIRNYINVILSIILICRNWPVIIFSKEFNLKIKHIQLKNGVFFTVDGIIPNADLSMLTETWVHQDYTPTGFEIEEEDVVMDIGANNGFFTVFAAKKAIRGKVISFEPVPYLTEKIKTNIMLNNLSNVTLEQIAISGKKGASEFYISQTHNGCHSLFQRDNLDEKIIIITTTLENYCNEHNIQKINFLKLDCEGTEHDIFNSLSVAFLRNNIDKIAMEYHEVIHKHILEEMVILLRDNNFLVTVDKGYIYAKNDNLNLKHE